MSDDSKPHNVVIWPNLAIWPARTRKRVNSIRSNAPDNMGRQPDVYDHRLNIVNVPIADSAYDRTVRLNSALQVLDTEKAPKTFLERALLEARLHLLAAKTEGQVRRDEIVTALRDLRNTKQTRNTDRNLAMLTTLRAMAILRNGGHLPSKASFKRLETKTSKLLPEGALSAISNALDALAKEDSEAAANALRRFFSGLPPAVPTFPLAGTTNKDFAGSLPMSGLIGYQAVRDGKITTDAADMISPDTMRRLLNERWLPKMEICKLNASESVRTSFGITEKTAMSGLKIKAKRLALTVGPNMPRLFTRPLDREKGGTVLIDASGSMCINPQQLQDLCEQLPMATVAYYNSRDDDGQPGGRPDFMYIYADRGIRTTTTPLPYNGPGNMIDFPALQWLLKQPSPRWFMTDEGFTGPEGVVDACIELLANARRRKLVRRIDNIGQILNEIAKSKKR